MVQDITWKDYFLDNERYADIINGIGCGGRQIVTKDDLQELDTQTVKQKIKIRDMLRKAAFGINFAIIGIENQEMIDYAMPLRSMSYDTGEYEKQAEIIKKEARKNHQGLSAGEYMYGFRKDSRLKPVVTFILYSGKDAWDGPKTLYEMLDFTDIPDELKDMASDYRVNLIEIRKLKDTSVFKTDVRQVFDFIRCSENRDKLRELVESDDYYKNMDEDAFNVAAHYTNAEELIEAKNYYEGKDGKVDMCRAIKEMIEEGREEGRAEVLTTLRMLSEGKYTLDEIAGISKLPLDKLKELNDTFLNIMRV